MDHVSPPITNGLAPGDGPAAAPEETGSAAGTGTPIPGPRRLLGRSLETLRQTAPDVRRGALAVGLQFLGLLGPVLVLVGVAVARLPDPTVLFGAGPPTSAADAELAGLVGLGVVVAMAGGMALAIESRAIGLALAGAAAVGRPLPLREALSRSRHVFWRLVVLAVGIELPLGLAGSVIGEAIAGPGVAGTPLAAGLGFLVTLVLQVPIAYAAGLIVVADLRLRAALRESLRLVAELPRVVPVVLAIGGAAQVLLVLALNGGLEVVALVADLADLGLSGDPLRTFATLALLLGLSSAVGSLLFSVTCLAVAPQAVVVALARPVIGLDRAAGTGTPGSARWLSVPMALGIATAVVVSVVGIQNIVGRA